jgi:arabinose-5-phosphate isomerase
MMLMSAHAASSRDPLSRFEQLRLAREIVRTEAQALLSLAADLDTEFCRAVDMLYCCAGGVIVTGMGKAGLVGRKITATLASTGTPSHYLHPGEAIHGDLGRIQHDDVVLVLSQSGETEEIIRILPSLAEFQLPIIAITGNASSTLGRSATVTLELGPLKEACSLGLAPSTSTTAMLALGDALALVVSHMRQFRPEDFVRFHPGGSLGRKLAKVQDVMRPAEQCRLASDSKTVRDVFVEASRPGRRAGAVMLTNDRGVLSGIFTDSDLARLFERKSDQLLDRPIREVMTATPATVQVGARLADAVELLTLRKLSELPVIDDRGVPVGLIDITDIVGLLPHEDGADSHAETKISFNKNKSGVEILRLPQQRS